MLYLPAGYGRPPLTAAVPTPIYHSAAHPTAGGVPSMDCPHYSADSHTGSRRSRRTSRRLGDACGTGARQLAAASVPDS